MRHIDYYEIWVRHDTGFIHLTEHATFFPGQQPRSHRVALAVLPNAKPGPTTEEENFYTLNKPLAPFISKWDYYRRLNQLTGAGCDSH